MANQENSHGSFGNEGRPDSTFEGSETESENRYIIFSVGEQKYAVPLLTTREVVESLEYREVPNTTDYFMGISNIRGEVVGLIDLAKMLGLSTNPDKGSGALIIIDCPTGTLGVKIDSIDGVKSIDSEAIERNPHIKSKIPQEYLIGVAKTKECLILILDLNKTLAEDDLITLRKSVAA